MVKTNTFSKKKRELPPKKGFRGPKYERKVRQYDLAPTDDDGTTRKGREIAKQMQMEKEGIRYVKRKSRQPDTVGLESADIIRAKSTDVEFKTVQREGESVSSFANRMRHELLREERKLGGFEHKKSEGHLKYKRELRAKKAEKRRAKLKENEKDDDFIGTTEHISFGEVVDRPPSFADIQLPGDHLSQNAKGKEKGKGKEMSNLEKLQRALASANADIREKYAITTPGLDEHGELIDLQDHDDDTPQLRELKKQKRKEKAQQREKMLAEAREKQHQVEIEKARLQAQQAYATMKSKKHGDSNRVHMGSLTASTSTLYKAGAQAMRNLHSVDGGIYHHGKK